MHLMSSMSGTGIVRGDLDAIVDLAKAHWPSELARLHEASLVTGREVVYDLTMFGEVWSPAYLHGHDEPVAWVNSRTKERRAGKDRPTD